jgi:2-keto-4-pentenoate hydratase/2-oxohepta-3-ene-1,7-dioic acid hydratase in catechol pathway
MKVVRFLGERGPTPGLLAERGLVDIGDLVPSGATPQETIGNLIDSFEELRPSLAEREQSGPALPVETTRLLPPLPRPRHVLCAAMNYWEHAQRAARPLRMFLKSSDAVIGPGDTIELPEYRVPWIFMHEAELALVIKGPAEKVPADRWKGAVFGYTALVDVSARGQGRTSWGDWTWLGKSFDTFCPLGPCIATADEIDDPNDLVVRFWNDGQLRHFYSTADMEHRVPELVEFATSRMRLRSGDVISCGTNHEGLGAIQDGETLEIEIEKVGRMTLHVHDPLKREWERGIYMGEDATHHEAVRRHRPEDVALLGSDESSL